MEQPEKTENIGGFKINTPTAIILAGAIVALAIVYSYGGSGNRVANVANTGQPGGQVGAQAVEIIPISNDDHFYGNPSAKVVLVEFSDTECPFCKMFHPTVKKIVDESKGQVAWVYRHFPLDSIHSKARKEAEATECAALLGGNDKFWEYIDKLFSVTPSNNGLDPAELPKIAGQIGLDINNFNSCLESGKYKDRVEANLQDGIKVGVTGTPATVIMNQKGEKILLIGAQPESNVLEAINSLMK